LNLATLIHPLDHDKLRALKKSPFAQSQRQAQILILEILSVFLWLKFSSSLTLNKIEHFSKLSSLPVYLKFYNNCYGCQVLCGNIP
jgi:hypothetical protein